MNEKELKKTVIGKNVPTNTLLSLKILSDLVPQLLLVYLVNQFITNSTDKENIRVIFIAMLLSFIFKEIFYYFSTKIAHEKAYGSLTQLRFQIVKYLKQFQLGFFQEHSTGELSNIIQHDVEQVEVYLAHGLPEIMSVTLLPIIIFLAMLLVDYRLALVMILGLPLMFAVKILSSKNMEKGFQLYFEHESKMREELMEYVKNISVIKAFAKEENISEKTLKTAREYIYWVKKSMLSFTLPMGFIDIFMEIGVVMVMILGSLLLIRKEISIAKFILAIILSSAFTSSISKTATLQHFSIVFQEALKSIGKILFLEVPTKEKKTDLNFGEIAFENISFQYEKEGFHLQNINLKIKENTTNALVGASGCGKSTLANLLMGFWKAKEGKITIAGKNIAEYSEESIAKLIGSVQQEVILFNTSIYENIAIGKEKATREEIIEAAKKARCHNFISALPHGYDTNVGEMGVKLSGGEKQRISIARMILKDAPILILDEAMAAVDSENEKWIGEAIEELSKEKTIISIAHHLNTIQNADQIIVMKEGSIVDIGKHQELMQRCTLYQNMVAAQKKVDTWNLKEEEK